MNDDKFKDIPLEIVDANGSPEEEPVIDGQPLTEQAAEPATADAADAAEEKPHKKSTDTSKQLQKAIAEQAREDEREGSFNQSLRKVLVGEVLSSKLLRNNVGLMILIIIFVVISITNRYTVQQSLLEQSRLKKELQDIKFRALSASSDLTERTRKSRIIGMLQSGKDSTLKEPEYPAFLIEVPEQ